jgi:hypothetical protein
MAATKELDAETLKSRGMVEKKTVINLIEAFSVAVKHYLRGEDGIYYQDLYYLVKFLPAYALPAGIPSNADLANGADAEGGRSPLGRLSDASTQFRPSLGQPGSFLYQRQASGNSVSMSAPHLPLPATSPTSPRDRHHPSFAAKIEGIPEARRAPPPLLISPPTALNSPIEKSSGGPELRSSKSMRSVMSALRSPLPNEPQKVILARADEAFLLPGSLPPKYHLFDLFPFSLLVKCLTKRGAELKGKKAARLRAKMASSVGSHNLPLEISLYLVRLLSIIFRPEGLLI